MKGPFTHLYTCICHGTHARTHIERYSSSLEICIRAMNPDEEFKAVFINATRQKLNELVTARVQIDRSRDD